MIFTETIIYLIRHAQSHPSSFINHTEWPLSTTGQNQALALSNLLDCLAIDKIFTSPFIRCKQTIEPYVKKHMLNVVIENDLRERLISKKIVDGFYEIWRRSWEDFDFSLPECESSTTAQNRFVKTVRKIEEVNRGKVIALSTHGNIIGLFINWIDNTFGRVDSEKITNPDILKVVVQNGVYHWDRKFILPGIKEISTDYNDTKVDK